MRIKGNGFSINTNNPNINLLEVIRNFMTSNTQVVHRTDYSRRVMINEEQEYFTGLVLTFKNQRKNCLSKIENGKFSIKVEDLQGEDKLVNFNFFCINKSSLKGLYLYYRGSCSLNNLFSVFQSQSNRFIRRIISAEKKALGRNAPENQKEAIDTKYSERVDFNILVDRNDIVTMLSAFRSIKCAGFRFDTIDFTSPELRGVEQFTRNTEVTFNIDEEDRTKVRPIADHINQLVRNIQHITKGRIEAIDHAGNERIVDLINSPSYFIEYEFDDMAEHVNGLTDDNFASNPIIGIIKSEMENGAKHHEFS
ncbi:hypothetical protein YA43_05205 [Enterobacter hormaechei subsp. steigerwaltii]|uniref:hypothetical protein n=1 Tax=Enterobacter hormaechei TaxID=158836 RepID=UPI00063CDFB3|nr:hypothetical protein [Enterobacter hormaechei]KLF85693.1 hypothetical protein YA43_05205 [Enterobacter hormaechei subsp. steigerwaltii]